MVAKAEIVEAIAGGDLLLAGTIGDALAANDRIKYDLTALQAAMRHAERPLEPPADLTAARDTSGSANSWTELITGSRRLDETMVYLPGANRLRASLVHDMETLIEPLRLASETDATTRAAFDPLFRRMQTHRDGMAVWPDDQLGAQQIALLTGAGDGALHRLVMDIHKELNRLQAGLAVESIDGARASGLIDADRPLVRAFMAGLTRTTALKFDHPGLGTTAARYRGLLSIQNDLGTTDAHVIVIRVSGSTVTVIYSDVHAARLKFFTGMFAAHGVNWQPGPAPADGEYTVVVGTYDKGLDHVAPFLELVGSRLVFVIDWNRARKLLKRFLPKDDAVDVLTWAAAHDIGHRGFLQAGGARLIAAAFERTGLDRGRFGERLDDVIGGDAAVSFMKAVLRIAASSLRDGRSGRFILDQIDIELRSHVETPDAGLLELASEQAGSIFAIAQRLCHALARSEDASGGAEVARAAELAKQWAAQADALVEAPEAARARTTADWRLTGLVQTAGRAAAALEETAFLLTLLPRRNRDGFAALTHVADLVGEHVREYVRMIECARSGKDAAMRDDTDDVLRAADRVLALERDISATVRAVKAAFIAAGADHAEVTVALEADGAFERAVSALSSCASAIRDYQLSRNVVRA